MKSIEALLKDYLSHYPEEEFSEAKARFYRLLEDKYGLKRIDLLSGLKSLSYSDLDNFKKDIESLNDGAVLQYLIGHQEFCGLKIKVAPGVLVPRPETEELVQLLLGKKPHGERILDIATGSACIALACADAYQEVFALEKSPKALKIAQNNAKSLTKSIHFIEDDILNSKEEWPMDLDVIVSNPPYVRELERSDMEERVYRNEPEMALFVPNEDPLLFYRAIRDYAFKALKQDGLLALEINQYLAEETKSLFQEVFGDVSIQKDQFGNWRFLWAKK